MDGFSSTHHQELETGAAIEYAADMENDGFFAVFEYGVGDMVKVEGAATWKFMNDILDFTGGEENYFLVSIRFIRIEGGFMDEVIKRVREYRRKKKVHSSLKNSAFSKTS